MLFWRNLLTFALLYVFCLGSSSAKSLKKGRGHQSAQSKLTKRRLLKEFRDIKTTGLSLMDNPFNSTADEMGVRLYPTNNIFEWHFSFLGVPDSVYEDGVYHGRIFLPRDYPRRAPQITVCTPNGRWEVNKFICLSATAFHQETWDTSWNLRTLVMALRNHMLTQPLEIGGISTSVERRSSLAAASRDYQCPRCGVSHRDLLDPGYYSTPAPATATNLRTKRTHPPSSEVQVQQKLANRALAKQMRARIAQEDALAKKRRNRVVRQIFFFFFSLVMGKVVEAMGGKSYYSFSFSL